MLTGNLEKIAEHGRRADNIVKSMLEHSRGSSGERRQVDFNGLIDEALNLAYHGARARDQSFNITLERDFRSWHYPDRTGATGHHSGLSQPNRQWILRRCQTPEGRRRHELQADTEGVDARSRRFSGNSRARQRHRHCPRGQGQAVPAILHNQTDRRGNGLGLSISYDVVTQQHGGSIEVESRVGEFTEFTVRLPRAYRATIAEAAS
jgi:signal transduction histidine kinase